MARKVEIDPNSTNLVDFVTTIMSIDSTTNEEGTIIYYRILKLLYRFLIVTGPLALALSKYLKVRGWHVHQQVMPTNPNRFNILATRIPYKVPGTTAHVEHSRGKVSDFQGHDSFSTRIWIPCRHIYRRRFETAKFEDEARMKQRHFNRFSL